jgi:arsenate reductase
VSGTGRIAFVCLHGSAKSLIAAEYLNRLARERGLGLTATTSGPEPDSEVPANVIEGRFVRGIDVERLRPVRVSAEALAKADHIVSFACGLDGLVPPSRAVEHWDDCPAVSENFDSAWAFIAGHVEALIVRLLAEVRTLPDRSPR